MPYHALFTHEGPFQILRDIDDEIAHTLELIHYIYIIYACLVVLLVILYLLYLCIPEIAA